MSAAITMIGVAVVSAKAMTPFERGRAAGRGLTATANPFSTGSVEHHDFEIGRLSGVALAGPVVMLEPSDPFFHRLD